MIFDDIFYVESTQPSRVGHKHSSLGSGSSSGLGSGLGNDHHSNYVNDLGSDNLDLIMMMLILMTTMRYTIVLYS